MIYDRGKNIYLLRLSLATSSSAGIFYPLFLHTKVGCAEHQGVFIFCINLAIKNINSNSSRPGLSSNWSSRVHLENLIENVSEIFTARLYFLKSLLFEIFTARLKLEAISRISPYGAHQLFIFLSNRLFNPAYSISITRHNFLSKISFKTLSEHVVDKLPTGHKL